VAAAFAHVAGTDRVASQWSPDLAGQKVYAFGYDGEGNVSAIGKYDATGTSIASAVCLRHDPLGRLVLVGTTSTAVTPGGTACTSDGEVAAATARYRYDGRQRRIARQVNGQWTQVVSDQAGNPLSELLLAGTSWTKVRDYVWLDGRLLAQVEYDGGAGYAYYAHLDHLGTPRALTSQGGQLVWSTFQRPYGEVGEKTAADSVTGKTIVTNLRLPGQYDERLLGSLGLQGPYYNWNRWYLPGVGRYMESDPWALDGKFNTPSGVDWYGYALENPLRYTDFMGLDIDVCFYADAAHGFGHVGFGQGGSGSTDGFYPKPRANPLNGPGQVHHDDQHDRTCKTIPSPPDKDKCMAECKARRANDPGNYRLFTRQCTSFVRDCLKKCGLPLGGGGPAPKPFFEGLP
jgi:RHS repeat-associated protein